MYGCVRVTSRIILSGALLAGMTGLWAKSALAKSPDAPPIPSYAKMALTFEPNRGQTDSQVEFLSRGPGYTLFLTPTEAVLALRTPEGKRSAAERKSATRPEPPAKRHVLRLRLVDANAAPQMTGLDALPGKSHYFIGNDPQKWHTNVPHYARVEYQDVYPGIDLIYYGNQRQLEYDFVVAPGADPQAITLSFDGADRVEIDSNGDLILHTPVGPIRQHKPLVYQEVKGARQELWGGYVLKDENRVGFDVAAYDARQPLIIDPVLSYSTYLGGSGDDLGFGIAVDGAGNAYVTGQTKSIDFPTEGPSPDGPLQAYFGGGNNDAFVTKVRADGTALVYSTYLGGIYDEDGWGIAVDGGGNAYVTGRTLSDDFPTTDGAFDSWFNGGWSDAFVAKLDATGALVYSTFLGGGGTGGEDEIGLGIAVDSSGNAYVTGYTGSSDFPTTDEAYDRIYNGGWTDAFVAKLNASGSGLVYATFLGGSPETDIVGIRPEGDHGYGIAVDALGNAYVTGETSSPDFPTTTGTSLHGSFDAFVAKLDPAGSALVYATFLGGKDEDAGRDIAVDGDGNAYVTGHTSSRKFPTTNGAFDRRLGGSRDAFMAKLDPSGANLLYGTFLGGSGRDSGTGIAVDSSGNAYVTGYTSSSDFPTTAGAYDTDCGTDTDGACDVDAFGNIVGDAFMAKVDPSGANLLYGTFLGGGGYEFGHGIAVDASGNAYVTGWTTSTDFPIAPDPMTCAPGPCPIQDTFGGGFYDAFVTKMSGGGTEKPSGFTLAATGYKVKGLQKAYLEWSGATSSVDIYRDGGLITTTENDGFYTDDINQKGRGSYTYQVCEEGTSTCFNEATVAF